MRKRGKEEKRVSERLKKEKEIENASDRLSEERKRTAVKRVKGKERMK